MTKRVVLWGTGFVGKMMIPEIVKHPLFDLVGVGVSNPDKVGRDVGEICGLGKPLGLTATDDVDYEFEMGIGKPPEHRPLLENPDILIFAWGSTVPMIAHAAGIELDSITTTWDKWVTDEEIKTAKGVIAPGNVAAVRFTINGV